VVEVDGASTPRADATPPAIDGSPNIAFAFCDSGTTTSWEISKAYGTQSSPQRQRNNDLSPASGERSSGARVRGAAASLSATDESKAAGLDQTADAQAAAAPPHPDPLPARGETEPTTGRKTPCKSSISIASRRKNGGQA
jgi:hypothetical protein